MISTKDIQGGGTGSLSKTLSPGNQKLMINRVYLQEYPYKENALEFVMDCEGPDLGEGFEGFFRDKNNPELGRHAGQVGRVKASKWAFADRTFDDGNTLPRDLSILRFMKNLCESLGCMDWLNAQDEKHETIEEMVAAFNEDAPFKGKFLYTCLAGREYASKEGGYINYNLFFPNFTRTTVPFENADTDQSVSKVAIFSEKTHVQKLEDKKSEEVESFDTDTPDFELG